MRRELRLLILRGSHVAGERRAWVEGLTMNGDGRMIWRRRILRGGIVGRRHQRERAGGRCEKSEPKRVHAALLKLRFPDSVAPWRAIGQPLVRYDFGLRLVLVGDVQLDSARGRLVVLALR